VWPGCSVPRFPTRTGTDQNARPPAVEAATPDPGAGEGPAMPSAVPPPRRWTMAVDVAPGVVDRLMSSLRKARAVPRGTCLLQALHGRLAGRAVARVRGLRGSARPGGGGLQGVRDADPAGHTRPAVTGNTWTAPTIPRARRPARPAHQQDGAERCPGASDWRRGERVALGRGVHRTQLLSGQCRSDRRTERPRYGHTRVAAVAIA
jgi:hypothetical protein